MSDPLSPEPRPLSLWVPEALANPEPDWILPGFIPAQGLVIVAGRPKIAMKSWFAYLAAMSAASGIHAGPFLPTKRTNVLFYSREGAPGPIAHRFKSIEAGHGISIDMCENLFFVQNGAFFLDEPAHLRRAMKFIEEHKIELVCIDTFARSFRGDENNARDVGAALRGVEKFRDAGAATLLVHHLGKTKPTLVGGEPDPDAGLRGSSALAGAYDNIVSIQELEVEGEKELWGIVGGKYLPFGGYEYGWEIRQDEKLNPNWARMCMSDAPKELPQIEPEQKARY